MKFFINNSVEFNRNEMKRIADEKNNHKMMKYYKRDSERVKHKIEFLIREKAKSGHYKIGFNEIYGQCMMNLTVKSKPIDTLIVEQADWLEEKGFIFTEDKNKNIYIEWGEVVNAKDESESE